MNIFSLLSQETVLPKLKVQDKEELINKLIDSLSAEMSRNQLESVREAVFERESIMSTGVGKGLAIPHGKASGIEENYASFAILSEPVEYESIDDEPVQLVFLLTGPESKNSAHIKLLSRISRLMNSSSFRDKLMDCNTSSEILQTFRQEEEKYFQN